MDEQNEQNEKIRKMDEARTFVVDHYPRLWKGLYTGLVDEGFSETQALRILLTYVSTSCRALP